jgi:hypothetical protein
LLAIYSDADADFLADELDHAIDHIITDHCPDEQE